MDLICSASAESVKASSAPSNLASVQNGGIPGPYLVLGKKNDGSPRGALVKDHVLINNNHIPEEGLHYKLKKKGTVREEVWHPRGEEGIRLYLYR